MLNCLLLLPPPQAHPVIRFHCMMSSELTVQPAQTPAQPLMSGAAPAAGCHAPAAPHLKGCCRSQPAAVAAAGVRRNTVKQHRLAWELLRHFFYVPHLPRMHRQPEQAGGPPTSSCTYNARNMSMHSYLYTPAPATAAPSVPQAAQPPAGAPKVGCCSAPCHMHAAAPPAASAYQPAAAAAHD